MEHNKLTKAMTANNGGEYTFGSQLSKTVRLDNGVEATLFPKSPLRDGEKECCVCNDGTTSDITIKGEPYCSPCGYLNILLTLGE